MFPVLYEGKTDEDIPRFKSGNKEFKTGRHARGCEKSVEKCA